MEGVSIRGDESSSLSPVLAVACITRPAGSGGGAGCSRFLGVGICRSVAHRTLATPRALCIIMMSPLRDIAKAYPSTPHPSINVALEAIGTPRRLIRLIELIYQQSTHSYKEFNYPLSRGIKEGCPLSPSLFVLVYEAFHATLSKEYPHVDFALYVDDVAIIAPDRKTLLQVLRRVNELSRLLGFKANPDKTQTYRRAPKHHHRTVKFWAKNSHFLFKTALEPIQNGQTKGNRCYTPRAA